MARTLLLLVISIAAIHAQSQNIGIGTTAPNISAALDISSNNKGLLIPRMSSPVKNAIISPAKGLMVYDSSQNQYSFYNGSNWNSIGSNSFVADNNLAVGQQAGSINSYNIVHNNSRSDTSGYFYDTGGPSGNYSNNENILQYIWHNGQLATDIQVISNNLENIHDSLILYENSNPKYVLTGSMTGTFRLYGPVMIRFKSNGSNVQAGFMLRWDQIFPGKNDNYDSLQLSGWYFNTSKLYMRGGTNNNGYWAPSLSGNYSFAFGYFTRAGGDYAVAMGSGNTASGDHSVALGYSNTASGNNGPVAIGYGNTASGQQAIAIGNGAKATGNFSMAFGDDAKATNGGSIAMGDRSVASGSIAVAIGDFVVAKSYHGMAVGSYNDSSDAANPIGYHDQNRIFQVGNGYFDGNRRNAMTILFNGNTGLGVLEPDVNLAVKHDIRLDADNLNNGDRSNSLRFGSSNTAEFIASKRTMGGNQNGLDFFTNGISRLFISNSGNTSITQNLFVAGFINTVGTLSVAGGKGIIRNTDATQLKKLSTTVTINTSFAAGETKSFTVTWPENFAAGNIEAYVGNITSGSGGWAEVIMTIYNVSTSGALLHVHNPRATSASPNFTVKVIAIGPQ